MTATIETANPSHKGASEMRALKSSEVMDKNAELER